MGGPGNLFTQHLAQSTLVRSSPSAQSLVGGGFGLDFLTLAPYLGEAAAIATTFMQQADRKKRAEQLVALTDERIKMEMEFAAQEEVVQVEEMARTQKVAHGEIFNTGSSVASQSYTDAAISRFGAAVEQREMVAERRDQFNRAKQFEAEDARRGADISGIDLFAETFQAAQTGFQATMAVADRLRAAQAAGDLQGIQSALFDQQMLESDANQKAAEMSTRLAAAKYAKIASDIALNEDQARSLLEFTMPGPGTGPTGPPPGALGAGAHASNTRRINPRVGAPSRNTSTADIQAFFDAQRRQMRIGRR